MKQATTTFFILFTLASVCAFSQDKKEVKKNGIKATKVTITDSKSGATVNESYTKFDSNGNIIEEIIYKSDGAFKKKNSTKYSGGKKSEETTFDSNGKQTEKSEYKYNSFGEKTEEIIYDENNNIKNKHIFAYDKKGMKTEKKTFDEKGNLILTKKYIYEY